MALLKIIEELKVLFFKCGLYLLIFTVFNIKTEKFLKHRNSETLKPLAEQSVLSTPQGASGKHQCTCVKE